MNIIALPNRQRQLLTYHWTDKTSSSNLTKVGSKQNRQRKSFNTCTPLDCPCCAHRHLGDLSNQTGKAYSKTQLQTLVWKPSTASSSLHVWGATIAPSHKERIDPLNSGIRKGKSASANIGTKGGPCGSGYFTAGGGGLHSAHLRSCLEDRLGPADSFFSGLGLNGMSLPSEAVDQRLTTAKLGILVFEWHSRYAIEKRTWLSGGVRHATAIQGAISSRPRTRIGSW